MKFWEKFVDGVAMTLSFVGGIAWLIYVFGVNIVEKLLGIGFWSKTVFVLVGASALWLGWKAVMKWIK